MVSFWCLYANFEDISHLVLVFVVNFEDVIAGWVVGLEHTQYVWKLLLWAFDISYLKKIGEIDLELYQKCIFTNRQFSLWHYNLQRKNSS